MHCVIRITLDVFADDIKEMYGKLHVAMILYRRCHYESFSVCLAYNIIHYSELTYLPQMLYPDTCSKLTPVAACHAVRGGSCLPLHPAWLVLGIFKIASLVQGFFNYFSISLIWLQWEIP